MKSELNGLEICVITNMYPSDEYPAYGIFVKNQVEQFRKNGLAVRLIYLTKKDRRYQKLLGYLLYYVRIFLQLLVGDYQCVYVHYAAHNAWPILAAKFFRRKLKVVVNVHGSDVFPEKPGQVRLQKWVKQLLQKADLIIAPSVYFQKQVADKYAISQAMIAVSASGGVDTDLFYPETGKLFRRAAFCVGYVGRVDKDKGWDDFLKACQLFQQETAMSFEILMVGSGSENELKEEMIDQYGLRALIRCWDLLPQADLREIYQQMDLLVFPSRRAGESLGLVGLEAMACGTPIIGSRLGGIESYVKEGENGFFCEPEKPETIVQKMLVYLHTTSKEKTALRKNARKTAVQYEQKKVNQALIQRLEELV